MNRGALVQASIKLHGPYNNDRFMYGEGPTYIHEVVKHRPIIPETGSQETVGKFAARLSLAALQMQEPSAELKKAINLERQQVAQVEFNDRWGYQGMGLIADKVLSEAGVDAGLIASLAVAQLDPSWVSTADYQDITNHANVMIASRDIAGHYHDLEIWAVNSD